MKTISLEFAKELINFAPTEKTREMGFGESQLCGAVAAHNMLARNHVAYLADEVGMGKTYVALGVMGLIRHLKPQAHVMVIAPRKNIQEKWVKELTNFVRQNWRVTDNCVRNLDGRPVYEPVLCQRLDDLADVAWKSHHRDLFLRTTSFSASVADSEARRRLRKRIRSRLPDSIPSSLLRSKDPYEFRDNYGRAVNALLPEIELLIIDEAHNLRHGFDRRGSNRNRVLGMALGHPDEVDGELYPWYRRRVRNVLLLSATPFEYDYADIHRQLDVLGAGKARIRNAYGEDPVSVTHLADREVGDEEKRELLERMLVRRVAYLNIGNEKHSKNMYRREWRAGGYEAPSLPMAITDPKQRLVVGLIQKKVAEVLQGGRFHNSFQIGMLSSFESFLETMGNRSKRGERAAAKAAEMGLLEAVADPYEAGVPSAGDLSADGEEPDEERTFDGDQSDDAIERRGVDRHSLATVVDSYRETFGEQLPHPKIDATASALADVFRTGEKALIFVRRVATVTEIKSKLDQVFDEWIYRKMLAALPELGTEIEEIFTRYRSEKRSPGYRGSGSGAVSVPEPGEPDLAAEPDAMGLAVGLAAERGTAEPGAGFAAEVGAADLDAGQAAEPDAEDVGRISRIAGLDEDDEGDTESFFGWFFRGKGPDGILSGAAFQKNRLASMASVYSTLFEDDHVAWLLGRPPDPIGKLSEILGRERTELESALRQRAFTYFRGRSSQEKGYPRYYVTEAYQVAALEMLRESGDAYYAEPAEVILHERYRLVGEEAIEVPPRFPDPSEGIGITTFFTELVRRPELRDAIWPDPRNPDFRENFRERERRRELIGAMARLGAIYIDLYLAAIRLLGSFKARVEIQGARPEAVLVGAFLDQLEEQRRNGPGFHAFGELSSAASAFETILQVNFPEAPQKPLPELARLFGQTLQHQMPVARMEGRVNGRVVRQFRMPGFPLVLATTDVLQEGEDLHTFCRRVLHYGITWTPSAMEQRTGRIDRIGSLVQRKLDGRGTAANDEELIQVYYPHLADTVEVFQVRRVLMRLNKFLRLIHRTENQQDTEESRIDITEEALRSLEEIPRIEGLLQSAFPVRDRWTTGELQGDAVHRPDIASLETLFSQHWDRFQESWDVDVHRTLKGRVRGGTMRIRDQQCLRRADQTLEEASWGERPQTEPPQTEPTEVELRQVDPFRVQPFEISMVSQVVGNATLIECESPVGALDLRDDDLVDQLYELQRDLGIVKVCTVWDPKRRLHDVFVREDRLFHMDTSQAEEFEALILRTVEAADRIEEELLSSDESAMEIAQEQEGAAGEDGHEAD